MKKIISMLLALSLMVSMLAIGTFAADTDTENPYIVSAVAMNDTQFKVTTSETITVNGSGWGLFVAKDGKVNTLAVPDRYGASITPTNQATTEFIVTMDPGFNATNIITEATAQGHTVYLGINGSDSTGQIDTARAVDGEGKGFVPNITDETVHGIHGIEATAFASNAILSVKTISDYQLEIEFTRPLTSFAGAVLLGILDTAGTGIYNDDGVLDDYAAMTWEIQDGKLVCWLDTNKAGMSGDGKNITKFVAAAKEAYPDHAAGIALLEANVDSLKNTGYLEQVVDADGSPLKGTGLLSERDLCAAAIVVDENAPTTMNIESVNMVSDYRLEIEFTKPLTSFAGAVLLGILNTAGTEIYNDDGVLDDYAAMKWEIQDGKLVCWLDTNKAGMSGDGKNITKFVAAVKEAYSDHAAGIALLEANVDSLKNTGYLEQVVDADGSPLKGTGLLSGRDLCAAAIDSVYESAQLVSASLVSNSSIKIKFDKEVSIVSDGGGFGIVALDSNGNVLFDATHTDMRHGGTVDKTSGTEFVWAIDAGKNAAAIIEAWKAEGYTVKFCSNSGGNPNPAGYNPRVVDANGNPMLAPVAKLHLDATYLYYALCDITDDIEKDLQEKIDAAVEAGQSEFCLNANVNIDKLNIPDGFTLDLNGYILTANYVNIFGQIKDSAEGKGGIAIAKNVTGDQTHLLHLQADNVMMPLYEDGFGYRFFTCATTQLFNPGTARFGFQININEKGLALLKDAANADVEVLTKLIVTVDGEQKLEKDYAFQAATIADYATKKSAEPTKNWAIILTVTGFEKLTGENITMTSTPIFTSSTGVGVAPATDATVTYNHSK